MLIAASCTWLWKPCKPTWKWPNWPTLGQFERYTVRNLLKLASVPELKQFLLENYSVELSPAPNHSLTVGYMSDGRTKCDIRTDKQSKWTAFKMQISKRWFRCFPVNHWVVSFMVRRLLPTTFFQSGIYANDNSKYAKWTIPSMDKLRKLFQLKQAISFSCQIYVVLWRTCPFEGNFA